MTDLAVIPAADVEKKQSQVKLVLPEAPADESGPVKAWEQPVTFRTYLPARPDPNPLFLEKRVYQGSSGRVYPLPVIDRIDTEPTERLWRAVHIENEFIRLMILPEIGGRIHIGLDKSNDYDFFYRQNVIKPALVGLAGPWISGGVEFNWPQHHRPATFMPMEVNIERGEDGSITVWCSDHDPLARMKGMHGVCLRPGKAYLELRVRLYNRTMDTQTFLWWANAATHVHEKYQSFFPKDVRYAADHAKRAITEYPLSQCKYYGIDYSERARHGVPDREKPSQYVPDGSCAPNDLGWYANIPVPTSYMIVGSQGDYFGGYDHKRQAGVVAIADHHIAPGKKQWTWGNHEFGYSWDRNLSDGDGPYIELMLGVYTDNQPDFSFLSPGETKAFSHFWYPIREIGVPDQANLHGALRVETSETEVRIHLQVTGDYSEATIRVRAGGREIGNWQGDLSPKEPLHSSFPGRITGDVEVVVEHRGEVLLRYAPAEIKMVDPPTLATEPASPHHIASNDELFLAGVHLEQYHHPTRSPEEYWREGIRRDAGDSRCNHALGRWHLRRGEFEEAERYLRGAIARVAERNPNPNDGEPHYNLGLTLLYLGRPSEAYDAFYKSTWNAAWRGPAHHRLAEIDCTRAQWQRALEHLESSLRSEHENLNARNLKTVVLRKLGREKEAAALLEETRALDPLDIFSRFLEDNGQAPADGQQRLDLGFDLLRAGLLEDSLRVFSTEDSEVKDGTAPLLQYAKAYVLERMGHSGEARVAYRHAVAADSDYAFPSRLEEILLLQEAMRANPDDPRAPYYLGNLLYDRRRHQEAIELWERATRLDPDFPTTWRNLGFGYFNVLHDGDRALDAFERARQLAPNDARILYEYDQLLKRTGEPLERRLAALQEHSELVETRDDLSVEVASLLNSTGKPEAALEVLLSRRFQPWEGGEGMVLTQYVRAHILLAQRALQQDNANDALQHLSAASNPPVSLSEAKHLLMNMSMIDYWLGVAHAEAGNAEQAMEHFERAARTQGDFQQMQVQEVSDMTFWSAMALKRLGHASEAQALFNTIRQHAAELEQQAPRIDYFATSLPAMLLFEEDLKERQIITAQFLKAQALLGPDPECTKPGLELLRQVLERDKSHAGAIDLLRYCEA